MSRELIADILLGAVDYSVTLRATSVEEAFPTRGIHARCAKGAEANRLFLMASRDASTVTVPAHAREQILQETMTTDTLVELVEQRLDALDAGMPAGEWQMLFCDESESWSHFPVAPVA